MLRYTTTDLGTTHSTNRYTTQRTLTRPSSTNGHLRDTMMKAAQYSPKSNYITVNEIPLPKPSKDQLLIKIASASLCHSDLMLL
jgi:hypothetical protein